MQQVYAMNEVEKRKLKFLYHQSAIHTRYSVLPDYSLSAAEWQFYPATENLEPFPDLELRMKWFNKSAPNLSINAIEKCIKNKIAKEEITHLITISCTGMSAPGLDLQIMELMNLPANIFRTSVNFMGCYAAIHGLKLADAFCEKDKNAKVLVVCTELCTLHFQKENSMDNMA
jgi:alkylresorcinol/alkylpyrone synthase